MGWELFLATRVRSLGARAVGVLVGSVVAVGRWSAVAARCGPKVLTLIPLRSAQVGPLAQPRSSEWGVLRFLEGFGSRAFERLRWSASPSPTR